MQQFISNHMMIKITFNYMTCGYFMWLTDLEVSLNKLALFKISAIQCFKMLLNRNRF